MNRRTVSVSSAQHVDSVEDVDGCRFILSSRAVDQQVLDTPVVSQTQAFLDGSHCLTWVDATELN
jgi:hypothetical protein